MYRRVGLPKLVFRSDDVVCASIFPVVSSGFEIETELTIHALELGLAVEEVDRSYYARPQGVRLQTQQVARRLPHFAHDCQPIPRRASADVLH
jgi:hypothetical protein